MDQTKVPESWKKMAYVIPLGVAISITVFQIFGVAAEKIFPVFFSITLNLFFYVFAWWAWKNKGTQEVYHPWIIKVVDWLQFDGVRALIGAILFAGLGHVYAEIGHANGLQWYFILFISALSGSLIFGFVIEDFDDEIYPEGTEKKFIKKTTAEFAKPIFEHPPVQKENESIGTTRSLKQLLFLGAQVMKVTGLNPELRSKTLKLLLDVTEQIERLSAYWPRDLNTINVSDFYSEIMIEINYLYTWIQDFERQTKGVQTKAIKEYHEKIAGFYAALRPTVKLAIETQLTDLVYEATFHDNTHELEFDIEIWTEIKEILEYIVHELLPLMTDAEEGTEIYDLSVGNIVDHSEFSAMIIGKEKFIEIGTRHEHEVTLLTCYDMLTGNEFVLRSFANMAKGGKTSTSKMFVHHSMPTGVTNKATMRDYFKDQKPWNDGKFVFPFGGYAKIQHEGGTNGWKCEYVDKTAVPPKCLLVMTVEQGNQTQEFRVLKGFYLLRNSITVH